MIRFIILCFVFIYSLTYYKIFIMKVLIKNMVSVRCKMIVEGALDILNIEYESIELGIIKTKKNLLQDTLEVLNNLLKTYELEIIYDKEAIIIEKTKILITQRLNTVTDSKEESLGSYLSKELNYNYQYIAKIFSKSQGMTLHKYFIFKKIEKIKQLLFTNAFTISEISEKMNFSNISHLSFQFKKETGLTPTAYRISV